MRRLIWMIPLLIMLLWGVVSVAIALPLRHCLSDSEKPPQCLWTQDSVQLDSLVRTTYIHREYGTLRLGAGIGTPETSSYETMRGSLRETLTFAVNHEPKFIDPQTINWYPRDTLIFVEHSVLPSQLESEFNAVDVQFMAPDGTRHHATWIFCLEHRNIPCPYNTARLYDHNNR